MKRNVIRHAPLFRFGICISISGGDRQIDPGFGCNLLAKKHTDGMLNILVCLEAKYRKVEIKVKVKPSVKKICEKCKIIKRHGHVMVICENPKHKQRQG